MTARLDRAIENLFRPNTDVPIDSLNFKLRVVVILT